MTKHIPSLWVWRLCPSEEVCADGMIGASSLRKPTAPTVRHGTYEEWDALIHKKTLRALVGRLPKQGELLQFDLLRRPGGVG